jgi:hypothetical protein
MIEDNTPSYIKVDISIDGEAWNEVKTFEDCAPGDHKYMVDPKTGTVSFGDGKHGLRPPAGSRITANYQTGGGSAGNILRFTWTVSDSNIPTVLSATITVLPDSFRLSMYKVDVQSWRWKLITWLCDALHRLPA